MDGWHLMKYQTTLEVFTLLMVPCYTPIDVKEFSQIIATFQDAPGKSLTISAFAGSGRRVAPLEMWKFVILWFNALVLFAMLSSRDVAQGLKPRLFQLSVTPAKEGCVGKMDPCLLPGADHSDSLSWIL